MAQRRGFSLVELLVTLAIVVVLAALLLPAVRLVRNGAQRATCLAHLRQVGIAIQSYLDDNHGFYPTVNQDNVAGGYPSYKTWYDLLIDDLDGMDRDRNGRLNRSDLTGSSRNVLKGCPTRPNLDTWLAFGYGMNGCLRMPAKTLRSHWDVATGYYVDWRQAQIDCRSERALVGDSSAWSLQAANPKYPDAWDPRRHGNGANYLFCDLHVGGLPPDLATLALSDPAKMP